MIPDSGSAAGRGAGMGEFPRLPRLKPLSPLPAQRDGSPGINTEPRPGWDPCERPEPGAGRNWRVGCEPEPGLGAGASPCCPRADGAAPVPSLPTERPSSVPSVPSATLAGHQAGCRSCACSHTELGDGNGAEAHPTLKSGIDSRGARAGALIAELSSVPGPRLCSNSVQFSMR